MSTWEERAAEARRLGRQVRSADADRRLLDLLLDSDNTAVSQAAADALLEQDDARGLRVYVKAFGQAEEDTRNKLGDCLYDDSGSRWDAVALRLPSLLADAEPEVSQGATVLAEHMRNQARHHEG
ncbi:MAG: hypothetical protein M3P93_06960 [Actinomycetota bacterium]|nr:hypothetical protein [Actinomycetota bacterium]